MKSEKELIAHLLRRASFGGTLNQIDNYFEIGYEETVKDLLFIKESNGIQDDLLFRYHSDHSAGIGMAGFNANFIYKMTNSNNPLQEKMALFWHRVFATGYAKVTQGRALMDQIEMFRNNAFGDFRNLLVALSKEPSMILWLDNHDNHKDAINENYGRELLELFSMGVGSYSEEDIKSCSKAFTGWTISNLEYMTMRANNDSLFPYGRLNLQFEYKEEDHYTDEIEFLGNIGKFNGKDIIDIICKQNTTAKFISRHLYSYFVSDEPPVSQWPYVPPKDPEAISILSESYFDSGYKISNMLYTLFTSDFFKSESIRFKKVKSPSELVSGVLKLTGDNKPGVPNIQNYANYPSFMGQNLVNPPSVEGWHEGIEWIDSGALVERVNFASSQFSDFDKPGIVNIVDNINIEAKNINDIDALIDILLKNLGLITLSDSSRNALSDFYFKQLETRFKENDFVFNREMISPMLNMIVATPDFQMA